ncbi:MAG TPA: glycogen debranching N-terminal domain-containing protein [Acidothermaceae bacterium]
MTDAWSFTGAPPAIVGAATATPPLVEGSMFCVATTTGDILQDGPNGLFFRDLRSLSRWELLVDGHRLQAVSAEQVAPNSATYICRVPPQPGQADSNLLVVRRRYVGDGMREDIVVYNLGRETAGCTISLLVDADFADLFEVKENRVISHPERVTQLPAPDPPGVVFVYQWLGHGRDVLVTCDQPLTRVPGMFTFSVAIPPREHWQTCAQVRFVVDGEPVPAAYPCGQHPDFSGPARRTKEWTERAPLITTPHAGLAAALQMSQRDLGSLRIHDPQRPGREVVAAGAPWFMTPFGRDSLLTAWMALPLDPTLALGTLETLATHQGRVVDPLTEEEPGRILHEMRFGAQAGLALGGGNVYYGSVDATPLFVMLVGEAFAWGMGVDDLGALLPAADAALAWIEQYGDRDGDGFVEYQRATNRGLANQGWKDSGDGITDARGRLAVPPIALCEVQGYTYAAYLARARIARHLGDMPAHTRWTERATTLKRAFNDAFWMPDRGYFALALDRDKKPVDSLASNIGHCLWTGIVDDAKAASAVAHLLSPQMFSGWGLRTLASSMGAFNPLSYHNGSVWPHDNAIAVAGLLRYGFVAEAHRVARAILEAAAAFGWRLPELWCGFNRSDFKAPLPYPTACSPQAWAAATPIFLLRSLLGINPWLPGGQVAVRPRVPQEFLPLTVERLPLGGDNVRLVVKHDGHSLDGLPEGVSETAALDA